MLSRRSLLGGLLACIPLFGMKKVSEKYHYITFTSNKYFQITAGDEYNQESINRKLIHPYNNVEFKMLYVKPLDGEMSDVLLISKNQNRFWVYNVHYSDCMWSYQ